MALSTPATFLRGDLLSDARDQGYLTWTADPAGPGVLTLTTGLQYFFRVMVPRTITVSTISAWISTVGATLTTNANNAGIYNAAGTQIAATADQTTAFGVAGLKTMALTSSVTIAGGPGVFVWIGLKSSGTTPATFVRPFAAFASGLLNANLTTSNYRSFTNGTNASGLLPASITVASNSAGPNIVWLALS